MTTAPTTAAMTARMLMSQKPAPRTPRRLRGRGAAMATPVASMGGIA